MQPSQIKYRSLRIETTGSVPSERHAHSAVCFGSKMIVFGGYDVNSCLNDTHEYDIDRHAWRSVDNTEVQDLPERRAHHTAVAYGTKMYVFGGYSERQRLNDLWEFDSETYLWRKIEAHGDVPRGRSSHSAIVWRNKMIVFGGYAISAGGSNIGELNDIFEYNFETQEWKKVRCNPIPYKWSGHTAVVVDNSMLLFGGCYGNKRWLNCIYEYNLLQNEWRKINTHGDVPNERWGHTAVVVNRKIIIMGGYDARRQRWTNDIYEYDVDLHDWKLVEYEKTPTTEAELQQQGQHQQQPINLQQRHSQIQNRLFRLPDRSYFSYQVSVASSSALESLPSTTPPVVRTLRGVAGEQSRPLAATAPASSTSSSQSISINVPTGMYYHSACVSQAASDNVLGARMIVFGGYGGGQFNDVYEIQINDVNYRHRQEMQLNLRSVLESPISPLCDSEFIFPGEVKSRV